MRKTKKKFFQTDFGKILKGAASILAPNLVKALDNASSVEEAVAIINQSEISDEAKLQLEELALRYEQELTKRQESDNSQELWLPKLVRPITLSVFVIAYISGFFLNYDVSVIHPPLMTVFAFYFGGRTWEKLLNKHV